MPSLRRRMTAVVTLSVMVAGLWAVAPGPVAVGAEPGDTFRVKVVTDRQDRNAGDGVCDTTADPTTTKCTLRAAIQEANSDPDEDRIVFQITGGTSPIKTIRPNSPLPSITSPLVIDGYTQAGAVANSTAPGTSAVLRIELDGRFITAAGLTANAKLTVKGLAIYWFGRGLQLSAGSDGSEVLGNFIGTDATGTEDRGNDSTGILVNAADVRIGSIVRADRNLISGNTSSGINLGIAAERTVIQGNLIGTRKSGRVGMANEGDGIFVTGSSDHLIGGTFAGQGNVIAYNGGDGVSLIRVTLGSETLTPGGNTISSNSIFKNGDLGIDLADDGVTRNDIVPDTDKGPNGLQNFPKLDSAAGVADGTVVRGRLNTRRDASFEIQLFATGGTSPEGRTLLDTFTVNTGSDGKVTFTRKVGILKVGLWVTATATDVARAQTSEFGPGRVVTP